MSFLEDYMLYASGNEVPKAFHRWSALAALSALIGRRVWLDQGLYRIYPNLYIVLVGHAASGKSTALSIARRLVAEHDDIAIAPSKITVERMTQAMGEEDGNCVKFVKINGKKYEYSQYCIFATELVSLLGETPLAMTKLLTEIWDAEIFRVETKNKGMDLITGPYVTLLGCMTPEFTTALIKQNIINAGLSRRCIFVHTTRVGDPVPRPLISHEQNLARARCVESAQRIREVKGVFEWGTGATNFFDSWYCKNYELLRAPLDATTLGFYRTKDIMVLKIAMLLSLAEQQTDLVIKQKHLQEAVTYMDEVEQCLSQVFIGTGRNVQSELAARLLTMLKSDRPVTLKHIYVKLYEHGDRDEIAKVIHHLQATDQITTVTHEKMPCLVLK